jgi:hypothetical protein
MDNDVAYSALPAVADTRLLMYYLLHVQVELESYMLQSQSNSPVPNSSFGSSFGSSRLLLTPQVTVSCVG